MPVLEPEPEPPPEPGSGGPLAPLGSNAHAPSTHANMLAATALVLMAGPTIALSYIEVTVGV
jgi:hypothetical protein